MQPRKKKKLTVFIVDRPRDEGPSGEGDGSKERCKHKTQTTSDQELSNIEV